MSATIKLLDSYKKVCSLESDNQAAIKLRISRATVSAWRKERNHPDADSVERMCVALGEPVAKWLPLIEAERARTPAAKQVWLRLAQAAAVVVLAFGLDVHTAKAASAHAEIFSQNQGIMYIM